MVRLELKLELRFGMQHKYEEIVKLLKTLVQTPSVNGVNKEFEISEITSDFALSKGLSAQRISKDTERPNLLINYNPDIYPKLLLVAHMDTVSPGQHEKWRFPPFSGHIENGRLYGRGAVDNKGGIVAGIACLLELKMFPRKIRDSIALVCVPDEESGATGALGLGYLIEKGYIRPCDAIYTYPGLNRIIIGHRGVLRLRIVTHGKSIHSGSARWQKKKDGCNAVTAMAEILLILEKLKFQRPDVGEEFYGFDTTITPGTKIEGGTGVSIVPDICSALVDIRLIPQVPKGQIQDTISETVTRIAQQRKLVNVEIVEETYIPPTSISPNARIVTTLQKVINDVQGNLPQIALSGPANESYLLNKSGFQTCVLGPEGGNMHSENEYVKIDSIFQAAKIYVETAKILLD